MRNPNVNQANGPTPVRVSVCAPSPHRVLAAACVLACAVSPLWLAGCATSADPHEGGFISGIAGMAGGGYQNRIDQREGAYQGELTAQQRLQQEAQDVQRQRAQVRGDLDRANARLADLERRLAQQRAMLRASGGTSAEQRRIAQAQARVNGAKGALGRVDADQQPVGDLKARSAAIQRDLDQIDSMVGTVGKGF
jgi:hypothetical protein